MLDRTQSVLRWVVEILAGINRCGILLHLMPQSEGNKEIGWFDSVPHCLRSCFDHWRGQLSARTPVRALPRGVNLASRMMWQHQAAPRQGDDAHQHFTIVMGHSVAVPTDTDIIIVGVWRMRLSSLNTNLAFDLCEASGTEIVHGRGLPGP